MVSSTKMLWAALVLVVASLAAAQTGVVAGIVIEESSGEPIPLANLVVVGTRIGAAAAETGRYQIVGVPVGRQRIVASAVGFRAETLAVMVPAFGHVEITIRLRPEPVEMAPVSVRPDVRVLEDRPVPTEVVSAEEIAGRYAANVQEALRWQPGVAVKTKCPCSNAAEVQIQGMAGKYAQVLVDGAATLSDISTFYGLSNLAAENVERLEIVKGAGGLAYSGDAIAGAVNIITKSADSTGGAATLNVGSYGVLALGATLNLKLESTGVSVSLSKSQTDPVDIDGDGNSDYVKTDRAALALKLERQLGSGLGFGFGTNVNIEERHGGALARIGGRSDSGLYQNPNILQWGPNATLTWQPSEATAGWVRGAYSDYRQRVFVDEQWFNAFEDAVFIELGARQALGPDHELHARLGHRYERLVENTRLSVRSVGVTSLSLHDNLRLGRLRLGPHARIERHSDYGIFLTPGLAAQFDPTDKLTLRSSFGLGSKTPPTFSKLTHFCPGQGMYDFIQNPDLVPEWSIGGTLGTEYHPGDFVIAASLFRTDLGNMIEERLVEYDSANRLRKYQYQNVGSFVTQGIELNAGTRPLAGFTLRASYIFTDARDRASGEPLVYRSRHGANWQLGYEHARLGLKLVLNGELVGSMPYQQRLGGELVRAGDSPTYTLWNIRASQPIGSNLVLSAGIENIFDYVQSGWLVEEVPLWGPSRGRVFNVGARLGF